MSDVREISVPGARLTVETAGGGEHPLVLLHGVASDRRDWDFLWHDLATKRRAIRYDLRGFGASVALNGDDFRHSKDLKGLLDAMNIERCDLAGASLGGSVALNFAFDHPDRVRRLALLSPGITAWEWSEEWRVAWAAIVTTAQTCDLERARELWFSHPLFATTRSLPRSAEKLRETLWAYSGAIWYEGDREQPSLPDLDRLPFLSVATLLLTGSADLPDFRLIAQLLEAAAPDIRRIEYEGAGHMLTLERPTDVAADLISFLR